MRIGDEVYVHGYVDEIRNDVVIIRNDGGYFGTVEDEVICFKAKFHKEHIEPNVVIEPTQVIMPKKCKGCDSASKIIEAYSRGFEDGADAVKAMPQTYKPTCNGECRNCDYRAKDGNYCMKTDCSWK